MIFSWKTPFYAVKSLFINIIGFVKTRRLLVKPEVAAKRLSICQNCMLYESESAQCQVCTCFMPAKVTLRAEKCPQGFWK